MKILILHPDFSDPGGVAAYYRKIRGKFSSHVEHFFIGRRPKENNFSAKWKRIFRDTRRFWKKSEKKQYEIVHFNPSLNQKAIIRDGIFIVIAKLFNRKIVVFFRGWQKKFELKIERHWLWLFNLVYGNVDAVIVLSKEYENILRAWGYKKPIFCEKTILDEEALVGFDIKSTLRNRLKQKTYKILFISRLDSGKGVYKSIEAVRLLSQKIPNIELVIAGSGPEMKGAKRFAAAKNLDNVQFSGYVTGNKKKQLLKEAHLLCYPTSYGEGMPNTVVESMGFGLPVVTRSVGGVNDFFKNRIHGFTTHRKEPRVFADMIEVLLKDKQLYENISLHNYAYSHRNFKASQASFRLDYIYSYLLKVD